MKLPPNLARLYVPGHEVTTNYASGMKALHDDRLEDAVKILVAEAPGSSCRGLAIGNAGQALLRLERFDHAQKLLSESHEHFTKHGCPHPPSWIQFMRNRVESIARFHPMKALQEFNSALAAAEDLAEKYPDFKAAIESEMGHLFNSWGGTCLGLGNPKAAIDLFQRGRDKYRTHVPDEKVGLAETLTNLALALKCDDRPTEASLALKEALDIARQGGDRDQVRRIEIASIQLDPSSFDGEPLELLKSAAEEAIAEGRYQTGHARQCIRATIARRMGKIREGILACEDAGMLEQHLDPADSWPAELRFVLAQLHEDNGSPAEEILKVLLEGARLWWSLLKMQQINDDLVKKSQTMHNHFRLLSRWLLNAGRVEEACMAFEVGRAIGFALEVNPDQLCTILAYEPFRPEDATVDCEGLRQIQAGLGENEAMVSISLLPPDLVAFVILRDSVAPVTHTLPGDAEMQRALNQIGALPDQLRKGSGLSAVPRLFQDFSRKIQGLLGGKRVKALLPNSTLHGIPWRALLRYSGTEWSQLSATTRFGLFIGGNFTSSFNKVTALGCGKAGSIDLNEEARVFASILGAPESIVENADSGDVRKALLQKGIVLISCHGVQKEDWNTGVRSLYLELQDGSKSAEDVWPEKVEAECVVLSACDSGVYEVAWGDYPIGAGPDLLRRGARCCLGTRFPVLAHFAAKLIEQLALRLKSGDTLEIGFAHALQAMEEAGADLWRDLACFEIVG